MEYSQEFLQRWNKDNNPFYPNEMRWDRSSINTMLAAYEEQAKAESNVTNKLLAERQKVLDAIPECPEHGGNCVPHALEWIERQIGTSPDPH